MKSRGSHDCPDSYILECHVTQGLEIEDLMSHNFYLLEFFFFLNIMLEILDMHILYLICFPKYFRHAHPGSPYVFGLVGIDHDLDFPEPMPVVGMNIFNFLTS
jgi:hypothetical protein